MGHSWVFLLCLSCLSACPAPTRSERRLLRGIVGETLSFNASVLRNGFLNYKDSTLAMMENGQIRNMSMEMFSGRLHWDNETGLVHITELNTKDSGEYRVQDTGGQSRVTVFQLTVYNRVSKPQVSNKTQVSAGSCPFLCSVSNGREVTLSWYREGADISLKHTSSPDLNTPLTLPLETEGLSHSYSCVAINPVSTQNTTVHPADYCTVVQTQSCTQTQLPLQGLDIERASGISYTCAAVTAESPISQCAIAPAALALKIAVTAAFSVLTVLGVLTVIRITADLKRLREQPSKRRYPSSFKVTSDERSTLPPGPHD